MSGTQNPFIIIKAERQEKSSIEDSPSRKTERNKNSWTMEEHLQYIEFFRQNSYFSNSKILRKAEKIFNQMTKIIPTRTSVQIKSHHQKLLVKYKNVQSILDNLERKLTEHLPRPVETSTASSVESSTQNNLNGELFENNEEEERSNSKSQHTFQDAELFDIMFWESSLYPANDS